MVIYMFFVSLFFFSLSFKCVQFNIYKMYICPYSTNGTVINMSKLVKKQTHVLHNGDVIYFVYRKSEPEQSE